MQYHGIAGFLGERQGVDVRMDEVNESRGLDRIAVVRADDLSTQPRGGVHEIVRRRSRR